MKTVTERFLTYVKHGTASNEASFTHPSTRSQLAFAEYLAKECREIGLVDVSVDQFGYVMATLPENVEYAPTIGFIAHMDTSPDAKGDGVMPNIVDLYDGGSIPLNNISITPEEFPVLQNYIGDTLITADGTTLLGADDKAGIAEILTAAEYLLQHPEIPHGRIRIAFTPDEEIGRGVDCFDVAKFAAHFAYTVDGGEVGELQFENFNAARAVIHIEGKNVHPGAAKNIMINAALLGIEISAMLPEKEIPAKTEGYEGFFHLCSFHGTVSSATLTYIIRDFDNDAFEHRKNMLRMIVDRKKNQYPNAITLEIRDEYYNMSGCLAKHPAIIRLAENAMNAANVTPVIRPIRGGTDGARLSYMGLPCPNLFTGGHNFHGLYEFIPVSAMEKTVRTLVKIAELGRSIDF